ncbi:hypothetical protein CLAFUW4_09029 [Fulvia fulva]|nr:hypothetical protein CLAFUR4_09035 [Fulvia fulva]KAK4615017.1 hypothetical protein CLAFUR0_09027 [Fulvia fulva]WPV20084.1 hypothetical protein CLAFUW4_09029 [Fulvia fulva]WPV34913.1 hypothetical protein CLAFUW7_09030 [Fulvia fulva]
MAKGKNKKATTKRGNKKSTRDDATHPPDQMQVNDNNEDGQQVSTEPEIEDVEKAVQDMDLTPDDPLRSGPSEATNDQPFQPLDAAPELTTATRSSITGSNNDPASWNLDERKKFEEYTNALSPAAVDAMPIMPRREFGRSKQGFKVLTNYVTMDVAAPSDGCRFLYEIDFLVDEKETKEDDMTKRKKRVLIERMIHKSSLLDDQNNCFVTDYKKQIISWIDLSKKDEQGRVNPGMPLVKVDVENFNPKKPDEPPTTVTMVLRYVRTMPHEDLESFTWGEKHDFSDTDGLEQAINLIISDELQERSRESIVMPRSNKIYTKKECFDLETDHKLAMNGFSFGYQSGMSSHLLNITPVTSFIHESITVSKYIDGRPDLMKHLLGVRVWLSLSRKEQDEALDEPGRRVKTIRGFGEVEASLTHAYKDQDGEYTVWDHFQYFYAETKGSEKSVCVNLGGDAPHGRWYLAEDLQILPYKLYRGEATPNTTTKMIRHACRTPKENVNAIVSGFLPYLGLNNAKRGSSLPLQYAGLTVYPEILSVPARNAAHSEVKYGRPPADTNAPFVMNTQHYGMWKLEKQPFLNTTNTFASNAYFLISSRCKLTTDEQSKYLKHFHDHYHVNGVSGLGAFSGLDHNNHTMVDKFDVRSMRKAAQTAQESKADLVVFILPLNNKSELKNYANFKSIVDQELGMKSLCLCEDNIKNCFKERMGNDRVFMGIPPDVVAGHPFAGYVRNVAMKLNVRLGNSNHSVAAESLEAAIPDFAIAANKDVMVLGADVVHPGVGSVEGTPSIAALVGSIDEDFAAYRGSARCQTGRQELITGMYDMAYERIESYEKANEGRLPSRILYYRDGIDEGQYTKVRMMEVDAIRKAWAARAKMKGVDGDVKITAVVVTKRHHTRFYPHNNSHEIPLNGNCVPGTVVDSGVTMPYNFDFFLLSHNAIKGTARPAHYIVLEDEIGFGALQIQNLTNLLCATYARSTTTVSYVPAAYYADHLCERVKQYLRPLYDGVPPRNGNVDAEVRAMWGRGPRQNGNPWNPALDETMFWI